MIAMANPLSKLKKLRGRSWEELRTRGEQVISAYSDQFRASGKALSDDELRGLLIKSHFSSKKPSAADIRNVFYDLADSSFFESFKDPRATIQAYQDIFSEKGPGFIAEKEALLAKADRILDGRFDLLGYQNLDFGNIVNWHYEPISEKTSPIKPWKQFDELSSEESGDKKIIWELNRHQHFFTLGVAYWLTGDERYAAAFADHIEGWMEQNPAGMGINWCSSLEVAFRSISWIWALNFFRESESLTPKLFSEIIKYLYLHGKHIEKYLSTYYSPNTHLTGEALGLYYLGTQLPFLQRAAHWRNLGSEILLAEIDKQVLSDGVYFEQSTWYQRYTADFYLQFLILKTLNSDKSEQILHEKLIQKTQLLCDFLMYITRPDGSSPLIGDDDGGKCLPHSSRAPNDFRPSLSLSAVVFGRGDHKFIAKGPSEELLWLLGADGIRRLDNIAAHRPKNNSRAFSSGGYYIMRDGWMDSDNYMIIDCGPHGSLNCGHSHADALSFDAAIGGRSLLIDPGTYTYHESKEARDFFRSTPAHNALSIDGQSSSEPGGKFNWNSSAKAMAKTWLSEERFDYFEGSQNGYHRLPTGSALQNRSVLFLKNDYWIIRDYVETFGTHSYEMNFHFAPETTPEIQSAENGGFCVSEENEKEAGLRIFTFGDNGQWKKKESWVSPQFGQKVNAPFLSFISEGIGSQEFFTFMLPHDSLFAAPEVFETEVAGGRAFLLQYRDYNDLFLFADYEGGVVRTDFFDTDFRFFWARMSGNEGIPEEFVMIDGSNFHLGGREVVNYPHRLNFATARRLGNKLNVRTDQSIFSVSLPQSKSNIRILKNSD